MKGVTIVGSGLFVPGKPITNTELSRVIETNDEWIQKRTGIKQRHYAAEGQGASDLAVEASKEALKNAGLEAKDIDYIMFCTMTPDHIFPGPGGLLGSKLGIKNIPALDIRQQCAAMPFAFQIANGLVQSPHIKRILLVGAEAHAGFMPWSDWDVLYGLKDGPVSEENFNKASAHRGMAVLFGDGAGAFILEQSTEENGGYIDAEVHSDGSLLENIFIEGGGFRKRPYWSESMFEEELHIPQMDGRDLFKQAVKKLPKVVRSICKRNDISLDDVDFFIPHQANDRINQNVANTLKIPEHKVVSNIAKYGNTSAATIPILTDELLRDGRIKKGDLICFVALGAGLHWGACLMRL